MPGCCGADEASPLQPRVFPRKDQTAMSRQDANAAFARTSFLYGGNAASTPATRKTLRHLMPNGAPFSRR
jgi:hypothetical protein